MSQTDLGSSHRRTTPGKENGMTKKELLEMFVAYVIEREAKKIVKSLKKTKKKGKKTK
jgi:hypothetical protein